MRHDPFGDAFVILSELDLGNAQVRIDQAVEMRTPATADDDPTRRLRRLSRLREMGLRIREMASRVVVGMAWHL